MRRVVRVLRASPDKWVGAWLNRVTPGPHHAIVVNAAMALSRSIRIERLARSAAVTRDARGPQAVAAIAIKNAVSLDAIRESAAAGDLRPIARAKPSHMLWLAWLLFVQHREAADYGLARAIFDHVAERTPIEHWDERFTRTYAEVLLATGSPELVAGIAAHLVDDMVRDLLCADAESGDLKVAAVTHIWESRGFAGVTVRPGSEPFYDRLEAASVPPESGDNVPLVSVVISSYRPDERLLTAVASVAAQSWQNLEIVVVDDASGSPFDAVYRRVSALDDRVRVHHMGTNGGTYAIRNWALDHAVGDFMTFHDSDDWMHPQRVAVQARALMDNPDQLFNTSRSARTTSDGQFSHTRNLGAQLCEPSLMIRRVAVRELAGYFDSVRKGADAEYRLRLERLTHSSTPVLGLSPLTLQLVDDASLSGSDIVRHWFRAERRVYRSCFEQWHRSGSDVRLDSGAREFYRPASIEGSGVTDVDVVVVSNWLESGTWNRDCAGARRAVADLVDAGLRVAIAHESQLVPLARMRAGLSSHMARLLNAGHVSFREDAAAPVGGMVIRPARQADAIDAIDAIQDAVTYVVGSTRSGAKAAARVLLEFATRDGS